LHIHVQCYGTKQVTQLEIHIVLVFLKADIWNITLQNPDMSDL